MASTCDDEKLAMDIAEGRLTQREMAIKHGLSPQYLNRIINGHARPDLQALINAASTSILARSRRLGARLSFVAWHRLARLAEAEKDVADETKRKAAVDLLKLGLPDKPSPDGKVPPACGPDLTGLTPETKAKVLDELGGPSE